MNCLKSDSTNHELMMLYMLLLIPGNMQVYIIQVCHLVNNIRIHLTLRLTAISHIENINI